jgi:hypothetical protein
MLDPFALPEKQFMGLYRLSRDLTRALIEALEPHLVPRTNALAIPNELRVRKNIMRIKLELFLIIFNYF